MTDFVGRRFGQYEILGLLGKGDMASVFLARQVSLNRNVAIKIIEAQDEEFLMRFRREADTVSKLSHPHILKVHDYGQQDHYIFLVMELLSGGSLASRIDRQGGLALTETTEILRQIASALDYAHRKGVIHRDIKPQNVLLDEQGNAFLTDFGIVKLLRENTAVTQAGSALGTPAYMAPEQWRGAPVDARSDIYALGVTVYEMLTGEQPFIADTPYAMMHKHIFEPPPSVARNRVNLPAGIDAVLERMLAKDPDARFNSVMDAFRAFEAAAAGQVFAPPLAITPLSALSASAESMPTAVSGAAQGRNSRAGLLAFGAILVVALIAIVLILAGNGGLPAAQATTPPFTEIALGATQTSIADLLATRSAIPSITPGATVSLTPTPSVTETPSATPSPTITVTSTATASASPTLTLTATPTATLTPSPTATYTHTASATVTEVPSATATYTLTATQTPSETADPLLLAGLTLTARAERTVVAQSTINLQNTVAAVVAANETAAAGTAIALLPTSTRTPTASRTPTPRRPTRTPTPQPTACPETLTVGCRARVYVEDEGLKLRETTSTNARIIENMPRGTIVTILDGPRRGSGYVWWYVETAQGNQGWCVEAADTIRTLIALP